MFVLLTVSNNGCNYLISLVFTFIQKYIIENKMDNYVVKLIEEENRKVVVRS